MLPHRHLQYIPLKTQTSVSVLWAIRCFPKTQLLKNKKARTWETATVEDIADETYNGPGNISKSTEMAWLCGLNPLQTQCHNGKGIQNLFVVTFKCNLYNAGGRFLGTYFKKLLDMMSISTLLEPLNILSGNPASESLLLWRYTDLLEGEKKMEVKQIVRSGWVGVMLFTKRILFKTVFQSFLLEIIRFVFKMCPLL